MPLIILIGFFVHFMKPEEVGDNFTGRVGVTIKKMLDLDFQAIIGLDITRIGEFADSGYVYLIYGSTILGLIVFWLFICLYPAGNTAAQRRCAHSLSLFIFLNMMIGGTAIFSIKIAGLLWLLIGYMRVSEKAARCPDTAGKCRWQQSAGLTLPCVGQGRMRIEMLVQLQYLRAIAALMVVYFHSVLQVPKVNSGFDWQFHLFGETGVDISSCSAASSCVADHDRTRNAPARFLSPPHPAHRAALLAGDAVFRRRRSRCAIDPEIDGVRHSAPCGFPSVPALAQSRRSRPHRSRRRCPAGR